jgi:hypothetical protein
MSWRAFGAFHVFYFRLSNLELGVTINAARGI